VDPVADEPYSYSGKLTFLGRLCRDRRLTQAAVAVASVVVDHANKSTGRCFVSIKKISEDTAVPKTTTIRALKLLEATGWINPEKRFGAVTHYVLTGSIGETSSMHGTGAIDGTGSIDGTRPTRGLQRGKTGFTHGAGPAPSMEPEQKRRATATGIHVRFEEFWKQYPRREAKAKALAIWMKHKLDQHADAIIADVAARIADPRQWTDPQFIPHATTYLNQQRWRDEWARSLAPAPTIGRLPRETNADVINAESMRRLGLKP